MHQLTGFEPETGLPVVSGNVYGTLLYSLTALVFLVLLVGFLLHHRTFASIDYHRLYTDPRQNAALMRILAGFLFLLSGLIGIYGFVGNPTASAFISAALAIIAGFSTIALAFAMKKGRVSDEHCICVTAPVFWVCLILIFCFRDQSANPVISSYGYELFAIAFSMLALFYFAGMFFDRPYVGRAVYISGFALFMLLSAYGGDALAALISMDFSPLFSATSLFIAFPGFLLLILCNALHLASALYPPHQESEML